MGHADRRQIEPENLAISLDPAHSCMHTSSVDGGHPATSNPGGIMTTTKRLSDMHSAVAQMERHRLRMVRTTAKRSTAVANNPGK